MSASSPAPMTLPLIYFPSPLLSQKSSRVESIDTSTHSLVQNLIATMESFNGAGLAAIQTGIPLRVFVTNEHGNSSDIRHFINPVLTYHTSSPSSLSSEDVPLDDIFEEGCLSIPGEWGHVKRPLSVTIEYSTLSGAMFTERVSGFLSRIIQHEYDHLNGVLFINRMEYSRRAKILKSIKLRTKDSDYPESRLPVSTD